MARKMILDQLPFTVPLKNGKYGQYHHYPSSPPPWPPPHHHHNVQKI